MKNLVYVILTIIIAVIFLTTLIAILYTKKEKGNEKDNKEIIADVDLSACVITMKRRKDRLIEFDKRYQLEVSYTVKDAVDGRELDAKELYSLGIIGTQGFQSIQDVQNHVLRKKHSDLGTIEACGCSLSHIGIWKNIIKNHTKMMLVMEDDALIKGISLSDIQMRLSELPNDWHIYMIGLPHTIMTCLPVYSIDNLYKLVRFCGTHAYIINYQGATWLMRNGKLFPINQQIDAHLSELAFDHGLNIYIHLHQPMYKTFGAGSDTQPTLRNPNITFDRIRIPITNGENI